MNRIAARLLTRLYPRRWRDRYGMEFEMFLLAGQSGFRTSANVVWSAFYEHIFPSRGGNMNQDSSSFGVMMKKPSAFMPLAMSLIALALVLGYIAIYGIVHPADEGAVAHLWQLLMAGQMPILAFFAIKWLPRARRQAVGVLALQAGAVLASIATVFLLGLG